MTTTTTTTTTTNPPAATAATTTLNVILKKCRVAEELAEGEPPPVRRHLDDGECRLTGVQGKGLEV